MPLSPDAEKQATQQFLEEQQLIAQQKAAMIDRHYVWPTGHDALREQQAEASATILAENRSLRAQVEHLAAQVVEKTLCIAKLIDELRRHEADAEGLAARIKAKLEANNA